jgi:hypothetical protein
MHLSSVAALQSDREQNVNKKVYDRCVNYNLIYCKYLNIVVGDLRTYIDISIKTGERE